MAGGGIEEGRAERERRKRKGQTNRDGGRESIEGEEKEKGRDE